MSKKNVAMPKPWKGEDARVATMVQSHFAYQALEPKAWMDELLRELIRRFQDKRGHDDLVSGPCNALDSVRSRLGDRGFQAAIDKALTDERAGKRGHIPAHIVKARTVLEAHLTPEFLSRGRGRPGGNGDPDGLARRDARWAEIKSKLVADGYGAMSIVRYFHENENAKGLSLGYIKKRLELL